MGTTRRALAAVALGWTFVAGGTMPAGPSGPAADASAVDPAHSAGTTSEARAPSCPASRVCFWSASDFQGTRGVFRPVGPGECLKIGDASSGYSSAYNRTRFAIRVWEISQPTQDGTLCLGRSGVMDPGQAVRRFSFGVADGLGDAP